MTNGAFADSQMAFDSLSRIRTLLYDDQWMSPAELDLLHTPSLQRLYDLHQLGLTDRVYIDASHSRLQHVVGVLEQVDKIVLALVKNLRRNPQKPFQYGKTAAQSITGEALADRVEGSQPATRLVGLLHDLTHAPYGHTVEDEINLVGSKHDEPQRQADAFYRLLCEYIVWLAKDVNSSAHGIAIPEDVNRFANDPDSEKPLPAEIGTLAVRLLTEVDAQSQRAAWRLTSSQIIGTLSNLRIAMTALLHLELLHKQKPKKRHFPNRDRIYEFQEAIDTALGQVLKDKGHACFDPHLDAYMLDVVGNTVCADLLDYAKRDTRQANIKLDFDADRIAENFTLVACDESCEILGKKEEEERRIPPGKVDPFAGACIRTAISVFSHKFRTDVPSELMNLLNIRYYLFERAIYHPTKCAAGAMLGTALQLLGWREPDKELHDILAIVNPASDAEEEEADAILPPRLRYVGAAVFLHDVESAARLAIRVLRKELTIPAEFSAVSQFALAQNLVERAASRSGKKLPEAIEEIDAGIGLLCRLRARRYLRPIFRALPNLQDKHLKVNAERMAAVFRRPKVRYAAERMMEKEANLDRGSIAIHCPRARVAEKIANALLVMPGNDGQEEKKCRLRDITEIDKKMFEKHQDAIQAVEKMYHSMWRLVVYASPDGLANYARVKDAVGKVLTNLAVRETTKSQHPHRVLQTDPTFEKEINEMLRPRGRSNTISMVHPTEGRLRLPLAVIDAGRALWDVDPDILRGADGQSEPSKIEIEQRLRSALAAPAGAAAPKKTPSVRTLVAAVGRAAGGTLHGEGKAYATTWAKDVRSAWPPDRLVRSLADLSKQAAANRGKHAEEISVAKVKKVLARVSESGGKSTEGPDPNRPLPYDLP